MCLVEINHHSFCPGCYYNGALSLLLGGSLKRHKIGNEKFGFQNKLRETGVQFVCDHDHIQKHGVSTTTCQLVTMHKIYSLLPQST